MNSMKRQNDRIPKEELPRSLGAQYATGDQWRNNSTKNEGMEPKQKQYPVVDVTGDRSKIRCCKLNIRKTKIWSHHFMANRRKVESSDRFPHLGSKITADGDFSHEIRR